MWAMEYNPNIYLLYDKTLEQLPDKLNITQLKQYGKFERRILRTGATKQHDALAIFLVASVLETKKKLLMKEAKGLDDVVEVIILSFFICVFHNIMSIDADDKKFPDLGRNIWEFGCKKSIR